MSDDEKGGTVIICRRGQASPCSVPGCNRPHMKLCDYALTTPLRQGRSGTCDAKLCDSHAVAQRPKGVDFCPPHDRMTKQAHGPKEKS